MNLSKVCVQNLAFQTIQNQSMIKNNLRSIANTFGYDIVKTRDFEFGKKFKKDSDDHRFDYYETAVGNYYFPKNCFGDDVANTIKTGRVFDLAILNEAAKFAKPDSILLDVGANYGQMAIHLGRLATNIEVHAFEAQQMVFDILKKNLEANEAVNVIPHFNAVYDQAGVEMHFPDVDLEKIPTYGSYGLDLKNKTNNIVFSTTIDSQDFQKPVSFMKIDVQGSDLAAMRGARKTIEKYRMPIVFEFEEQFQADFNTTFQDYVDFVASIRYKFLKTIQDINFVIVPVEYSGR